MMMMKMLRWFVQEREAYCFFFEIGLCDTSVGRERRPRFGNWLWSTTGEPRDDVVFGTESEDG